MNFKIRSFKPGDQATSYRYSWCQKRVQFWFKGGIQKEHNNVVYRNSNKMSLKAAADPGEGPRGTQPPLIFSPNWGLKAQKVYIFLDHTPLPPLSEGLDLPLQGSIYICGNEEHGTKYVFWSTWVWTDLAPAMLSARRSINSLKLGSSCKKTHWNSRQDGPQGSKKTWIEALDK